MQISREAQKLPELDQIIHPIYRHGKLRFWMKSQPTSPSLLKGFENYICAKSGKAIAIFSNIYLEKKFIVKKKKIFLHFQKYRKQK